MALSTRIVPVTVSGPKGQTTVEADEHPRDGVTAESLAGLPAAFRRDGTVTAGSSSGLVDGAAAMMVLSAEAARRFGVKPQARVVAYTTAGVDPAIMGIGPVPAIRQLLERTGLGLDAIDLIEINEAFAAQYLGCEKELGLARERVNVNGGAISLGHPLGATGARLILTLVLELRRSQKRYGVASACIGGGQGIAMIIRREA